MAPVTPRLYPPTTAILPANPLICWCMLVCANGPLDPLHPWLAPFAHFHVNLINKSSVPVTRCSDVPPYFCLMPHGAVPNSVWVEAWAWAFFFREELVHVCISDTTSLQCKSHNHHPNIETPPLHHCQVLKLTTHSHHQTYEGASAHHVPHRALRWTCHLPVYYTTYSGRDAVAEGVSMQQWPTPCCPHFDPNIDNSTQTQQAIHL